MRCVIQIIIKILHSRNSWQLAKILKWNRFEMNFQKTQACNDVYCGGLFINQTHSEETVESAVLCYTNSVQSFHYSRSTFKKEIQLSQNDDSCEIVINSN